MVNKKRPENIRTFNICAFCEKLEFRGAGSARERDDVPNVLHAGDEQDQALKAQAEAGVRA